MPCLNEEVTLGNCIKKALASIEKMGIKGEVVVSDNGSTDRSVEIARSLGARVVHQPRKGYGNALMKGIRESRGKYIIMGDADESYDFSNIEGFVEKLREGYDVVMGTRLKGKIEKGAMSLLHRLGNPVMTFILNVLFKVGISDAHCGLRAFTKASFEKLELKCGGMEFASEHVVKAAKEKLKVTEIPITLYPDKRNRPPHLKTFEDGWRHLRFLLLYSPTFLYLIPGLSMFAIGLLGLLVGLLTPFTIMGFRIDYHFTFLASVLTITGFQICVLGILARSLAYVKGFDKYDRFIVDFVHQFSLEKNLAFGFLLIIWATVVFVYILAKWLLTQFGPLFEVRSGIVAVTLFAVGLQYIFCSCLLNMFLMEFHEQVHSE